MDRDDERTDTGTAAMSEDDPERTHLGGHLEGVEEADAAEEDVPSTYAATLARVLGRPSFLSAPRFALRLLLGELAEELLFVSQRVRPAAAQASGYAFRFPDLEPALRHVLNRPQRP